MQSRQSVSCLVSQESHLLITNSDVPRVTKTKTGKTVRIISPHSATSEDETSIPIDSSPPSRVLASPPPDTVSFQTPEDESPADPFGAESDTGPITEDESTRQNTLSNSGHTISNPHGTKPVPVNPFAKTLASLNAENQSSPANSRSEQHRPDGETNTNRPHYDVDDFKRLLLKGEKNVPGTSTAVPTPVSFQRQHSIGDSSSNTDASSISRQSIFEPTSGPAFQESPRSSHDISPTDEERQQPVGGLPPTSGKIKPTAPKPRHGKLVKINAPQTVSFEDPTLSFSSSTTSVTFPPSPAPKLPSTMSGVEKPLPALPDPSKSIQFAESVNSETEPAKGKSYSAPSDTQAGLTSQKRNPPAPPLSRRHSLRPKPFATSERSTPISEEGSQDSLPLSQSPPTTSLKAPPPPPPPPRRSGQVRGDSPSSISTSASPAGAQSQLRSNEHPVKSTKVPPPTPPNRSPSLSAVKRQSTQTFSGSPSMAPPPPPRRRGSSASSYSYNPSRLSGNYSTTATERMRSDSNASSISQLPLNSPTASNAESRDVLADLSALQREVDELRGKFGNG